MKIEAEELLDLLEYSESERIDFLVGELTSRVTNPAYSQNLQHLPDRLRQIKREIAPKHSPMSDYYAGYSTPYCLQIDPKKGLSIRNKEPYIGFNLDALSKRMSSLKDRIGLNDDEKRSIIKAAAVEEEAHFAIDFLQGFNVSKYLNKKLLEVVASFASERELVDLIVAKGLIEITGGFFTKRYLANKGPRYLELEMEQSKMDVEGYFSSRGIVFRPQDLDIILPTFDANDRSRAKLPALVYICSLYSSGNAYILEYYLADVGRPYKIDEEEINRLLNSGLRNSVKLHRSKISPFLGKTVVLR